MYINIEDAPCQFNKPIIYFISYYLCYGFNLNKCEVEHLQPKIIHC